EGVTAIAARDDVTEAVALRARFPGESLVVRAQAVVALCTLDGERWLVCGKALLRDIQAEGICRTFEKPARNAGAVVRVWVIDQWLSVLDDVNHLVGDIAKDSRVGQVVQFV